MIIPKFRCYQDHKFVHVEIVLSALCKVAEAQFSISEEVFTFSCSPYFMRLRFDAPLCEGQGESATYNVESNVLNVRLPKLSPGEVFKTLDFPNMLLATTLQQQRLLDQMARNAKAAAKSGNDGSGDAAQDDDEDEEGEEDLEETEFDQHDQLAQQLQRLTVGDTSATSEPAAAASAAPAAVSESKSAALKAPVFYGFNKSFSGVLAGLDADVVREFVSLPNPEQAAPATRTQLREARENADFNEDQFVFSMVDEDGEVDAVMEFRPWYVRLYEQGLAQARGGAIANDALTESKAAAATPAPPVTESRPMLAPAHPGAIGAMYATPAPAVVGPNNEADDDDDDAVPNDALKGIADATGTVTAWSGNVQPLADADQAAAAAAAAAEIIKSLESDDAAAPSTRDQPAAETDSHQVSAPSDHLDDAAGQIRTVRPTRSGLAVLCPAPHPTLAMSEAALLAQLPATPNPLLHRPAQSIAALVDILAATAYDIQTNEGQRTVESGWNIAILSPALQWLDDTRAHPADVAIAFCRRVATYPLHRSFHLALRCLRDVGVMLLQGPTVCVKVLLHAKAALDASERQHVLSTLWVNPMLSWLSAAAAARDEPAQQLTAAMEDYADVMHAFVRTGQRRPFLASYLAAAEPSALEELAASRRKLAVEALEPLNWRLLRLPLSNELLQSPE